MYLKREKKKHMEMDYTKISYEIVVVVIGFISSLVCIPGHLFLTLKSCSKSCMEYMWFLLQTVLLKRNLECINMLNFNFIYRCKRYKMGIKRLIKMKIAKKILDALGRRDFFFYNHL